MANIVSEIRRNHC